MSGHYSSDYPDGFEEKLIAAGAKTQTITPVYRILYDGKLNALNFESTYINYRRRHKTLTKRKLQHLGTYSTSCFLELGDTVRLLRCSMNNPPFAKICKGIITQTSGYSQRTAHMLIGGFILTLMLTPRFSLIFLSFLLRKKARKNELQRRAAVRGDEF